jgi:hypothetical protein
MTMWEKHPEHKLFPSRDKKQPREMSLTQAVVPRAIYEVFFLTLTICSRDRKFEKEQSVVVRGYNPRTWKAEAGGL